MPADRGDAPPGRRPDGPARRARGRPGRPRGRHDARRPPLGRRRPQAPRGGQRRGGRARSRTRRHGEIEVADVPARLVAEAQPRSTACRSSAASSRSPSRWRSASRRSASPPTRSSPRTRSRSPAACGSAPSSSPWSFADRPVLRRPGRADEPDQGPARLLVPVLARRGHRAHRRSSSATCALLSRLRDLRRVFEYHGAEHKTIACYEAGDAARPRERAALLAACTRAAARASC